MTVTAAHMTNGHKAPAPPPAGTAGPAGAPRLAAGVELLGTYQNSGYSQPPSLVRRPDGQVIQMSSLLYQVTSRIDGSRDPAAIADLVSADIGRSLTADQVRYLITAKLMPLGIVGGQDAPTILPKASPLLALRARCTLLPELRRERGRSTAAAAVPIAGRRGRGRQRRGRGLLAVHHPRSGWRNSAGLARSR